jgi:hypothetical protein
VNAAGNPKGGAEISRRSDEKNGERLSAAGPAVLDLLGPMRRGQGVRIGCVGPTGSGKSFALRSLVTRAAAFADLVYVCADKPGESAEWSGQERVDLDDCRERPLIPVGKGGSKIVVLGGDPFKRRNVDPETVARDAWANAAPPRRFRAVVVVDELRRAAKGQAWRTADGDLPRVFTEGRSVGISALWGAQSPQEVPREALGQSDLLIFQVEGREAEYLRKYRLIDNELADLLPSLPRHAFVVRRNGSGHDGRIYRF